MKKYLQLFYELFKISLFVIGGGYAILAVADQVFAKRKWTRDGELLEHLPVFQMIPGLIATHTAVYVGRKIAGPWGAALGVFAVALPSIVIFTAVSIGYDSLPVDNAYLHRAFIGLRSALTGIIAATLIKGWTHSLEDAFGYSLFVAALVALVLGIPVPIVLVAAMLAGFLLAFKPKDDPSAKKFSSSPFAILLFLKYGLLCFGGGFVLVPMYIEDFVGPTAPFLQITAEEFSNLIALTQLTPGPIGVNGATYFGFRLAGIPGAVLASAALLLPGSVLAYLALTSLERFQQNRFVRSVLRGVRPASVALMLVALFAFAKMSVYGDGRFNLIGLVLVILSTGVVLMKKINVILLIFLSAFASLVARAETNPYPDADSVLLNEIDRVRYRPDGTYVEEDESWTRVLTEKGRREESSISLGYSKRYSAAEISYVGVIDTNGVERAIDLAKTLKESTDNRSMASNIYDPLDRRIVCTIPGLQVGETTHVKMSRTALHSRCEGVWADLFQLEHFMPMERVEVEITAPKELPLEKIAIRNPLGNVVESRKILDDGSRVYSFVATNSPQAFPEPDMPSGIASLQALHVSTAKSWPEISKWYWNLSEPHLKKTTSEMTNEVRRLVAQAKTDEEKMRAVFKFVSQEIRYMGLTMEDVSPGYAPHDVDITFNNRYGVCRDKAALCVVLLRLAGLDAYPTLIHVGDKRDPEIPQPFFNHAIVAVQLPNEREYVLLDPTNEHTKDLFPAYESDKSYLVCRPEGEELKLAPTPPAEHNAFKVDSYGRLNKNGSLLLESHIAFDGVNDTIYRGGLLRKTPEDRVKFFERIVRAIQPGARMISCVIEPKDMSDTETPIRVELMTEFPEMLLRGETSDELALPYFSQRLGLLNYLFKDNVTLEKRRFPLQIDSTALNAEKLTIELNDAVGALRHLPKDVALDGAYRFLETHELTNGVLTVERRVSANRLEMSPEDYRALRRTLKEVEDAERRRVVFGKDPLGDADVKMILNSTDVSILSDFAWVKTNRVEKEILNYEGKKNSAELKIAFNPSVGFVRVLSASVSNRNGRVSVVSPKEMNVMDAGWVARAPRYPASKLLVVNFPSVEIGSVISYAVETVVTNAPTSFYGEYLFDSTLPTEKIRVRVNEWSREVVNPKRIPKEAGQPDASLWRDHVIVSSNRIGRLDLKLSACPISLLPIPVSSILDIRNWMAKNVRVAGPDLWEVPLSTQLTAPEAVIRECYATELDYIRTMAALLRGAGYEADVVLAADDALEIPAIRGRIKSDKPNLKAFDIPLCRVRTVDGVFFVGTENEYAELGASAYEGADYLDPATGRFGYVTVPRLNLSDYAIDETRISLSPDGCAAIESSTRLFGSGVASFRRKYEEILPEDRRRHHQTLLSSISQGAKATGELKTETKKYPVERTFSCEVPNFATVEGDLITLEIPELLSAIPSFPDLPRSTPFVVESTRVASELVEVRFPEGYAMVEHLPKEFQFANPKNPQEDWLVSTVNSRVVGNRLVVRLSRKVLMRWTSWHPASSIGLLKDWSRISASRASRTLVVRRTRVAREGGERE